MYYLSMITFHSSDLSKVVVMELLWHLWWLREVITEAVGKPVGRAEMNEDREKIDMGVGGVISRGSRRIVFE